MEREEGELSDEEYEDVSDNSCISTLPLVLSGKSPTLSAGREPFRELSLTSVSDESVESDFAPRRHAPSYTLLAAKHPLKAISARNGCRKHTDYYKPGRAYIPSRRRKCSPRPLAKDHVENVRRPYSNVSSSSDTDHCVPDKRIWRQLRDAVRINSAAKSSNCSLRTRLKRMIAPECKGPTATSSDADDHELEALRDQALQSKHKTEQQQAERARSPTNISDEDLINLRLVALHSAVLKKHQNRLKQRQQQQQQQQRGRGHGHDDDDDDDDEAAATDCNGKADATGPGSKPAAATTAHGPQHASDDEDEDILRAMVLTSICNKMSGSKTLKAADAAGAGASGEEPAAGAQQQQRPRQPQSAAQPPARAHTNRFIINVNSDSESDEQMSAQPCAAIANSDLFDKNLCLFLKQARAKAERNEGDVAKHLPRAQQLEYRRLKRRLHYLSGAARPDAAAASAGRHVAVAAAASAAAPTAHPPDKHFKRVSRLRMKGKYEELEPLMARVTEARHARDQAQAEVKRLINCLRLARLHLTVTHKAYTLLIQQLVHTKTNIDKRLTNQQTDKSKPVRAAAPSQEEEEEAPSVAPCEPTSATGAPAAAGAAPPPATSLLSYSSPLEHIQSCGGSGGDGAGSAPKDGLAANDPLLVLCPYDLLGVCRDVDCPYRHCGAPATAPH